MPAHVVAKPHGPAAYGWAGLGRGER
jgi:hypothetical protein